MTTPGVIVVSPDAVLIISVADQGPTGPPGDTGPEGPAGAPGTGADASSIGGIPIVLTSLQTNDLLQYTGSAFVNVPETSLVDGGNF